MATFSTTLFLFFSYILTTCIVTVFSSCYNKYELSTGISCKEKKFIVDTHNQLRQSVALGRVQGQPAASKMLHLSWDEELAKKAQQLANTCHYGHDSSSARSVSRFFVGQNIATTWTSWKTDGVPDFATQIKAWFDEVYIYTFNSGFSHATGHYSQMVWGDTYLVGCGYKFYYDGYRYQKLYVCNYGPGGNVIGKAPYQPGYPSCYEYGMSSSPKYTGLCIPDSYRHYPDYQCYYK